MLLWIYGQLIIVRKNSLAPKMKLHRIVEYGIIGGIIGCTIIFIIFCYLGWSFFSVIPAIIFHILWLTFIAKKIERKYRDE